VIESGVLAEAGDHYKVAGPLTPLAIPTSLHASLLARLDRLAPAREVAQIAAALGRQFSHELISAVTTMSQQQLDNALDQLVASELVFRRGIPPDSEYTFKHALVQEAAYSTLLKSKRQQIHGKIATTLEEIFPEIVAAQPALLARHCTEAGLIKQAIEHWLKAGQQSVGRSAMAEAVVQLEKGLELIGTLTDDSWRGRKEIDLQMALGPALIARHGWAAPVVGETYARARSLAEGCERSDYLLPLLWAQWIFHVFRGEMRLALSIAEQVSEVISPNPNGMLGVTHLALGEFVSARDLLQQFCRIDPGYGRILYGASHYPTDPYAWALGYLGLTLTCLGQLDQGRAKIKRALREARQLGRN
jgi:predicted ATPase